MQGVLLHRVAGRQDRDPGEKGVLTDMTGYNSGHVRSRNNSVPFVHLRVHSEFSVVDGIVRIPDLIKRVAKLGQPAVALTDLSNLFGLIKFYKRRARRRDRFPSPAATSGSPTTTIATSRSACCCWCATTRAT